jgi:O-antigen ligase
MGCVPEFHEYYGALDHGQQPYPSRTAASALVLASAVAVSLAVIFLINLGEFPYRIAVAAAFAVVCWAASYAKRHREWVPFALVLIQWVPATAYLDDDVRALIHYGLYALFCIPLCPIAWRSGLLGQGGFRHYLVYFGWALLTVTYSLAPEYSFARLCASVTVFLSLVAIASEVTDEEGVIRLFRYTLFGYGAMLALVAVSAVVLPKMITWSASGLAYPWNTDFTDVGELPRFRSIFYAPNEVGELMLPTAASVLLCWRSSRNERWLLLLLTFFAMFFAALADSRSPFLAMAVGGAAYLIWKKKFSGVMICAAIALATLAISSLIDSEHLWRGAETLTGRTDIWPFELGRIAARPILGYGYEVEGEIFKSKYFPVWWGPFDFGPHSSLHNSYLSRAIGVGIPFTLFWLFFALRPWIILFRQTGDPWNLKPVALFVVLPLLLMSLVESNVTDGAAPSGEFLLLAWTLAERRRVMSIAQAARARVARPDSADVGRTGSPALRAV